jgi:hypothetical protein
MAPTVSSARSSGTSSTSPLVLDKRAGEERPRENRMYGELASVRGIVDLAGRRGGDARCLGRRWRRRRGEGLSWFSFSLTIRKLHDLGIQTHNFARSLDSENTPSTSVSK